MKKIKRNENIAYVLYLIALLYILGNVGYTVGREYFREHKEQTK